MFEYVGDIREDDFFNILHEDKFSIEDINVDINPITRYKTGTMEEYLQNVIQNYDGIEVVKK